MSAKLEVSFNSPQCGWMSIGFDDGINEFHTTTAHAPHSNALSELLNILVDVLDDNTEDFSRKLEWNRDPEEFDFIFGRKGAEASIKIIEYPTGSRDQEKAETVYVYSGDKKQIAQAFYKTFRQLYDERNIDEFEQNWHQKFPVEEMNDLFKALEK